MVRPRKYVDPAQAAAAKTEQDRQRYLARGARKIQKQVPRFVPFMPLPEGIPPPTPAQLNLRIDVPEVIALNPRDAVASQPRFHGPEPELPYRLSTPLPLPPSALSRIDEQVEDGNTNDASEPNWGGDGDDEDGQDVEDSLWMTNALSLPRTQTPEPVLVSNLDGEAHDPNRRGPRPQSAWTKQ